MPSHKKYGTHGPIVAYSIAAYQDVTRSSANAPWANGYGSSPLYCIGIYRDVVYADGYVGRRCVRRLDWAGQRGSYIAIQRRIRGV